MTRPFEPIRLEQQDAYLEIFRKCPQKTSDYSFLNLWGWAEEYGLEWSWEKDLVWIRQTRPETFWWAPVGAWTDIDWTRLLPANGSGPRRFIRVPERLADQWQAVLGNRVRAEKAREHWDYVYAVADLVALKGNRYHKKKNLLNQFVRNYRYQYVPFEGEMIERARAMQVDWCQWRDCESSEVLSAENRAIHRVFDLWEELKGAVGAALMVEEAMVAYTVAERLSDEMLLIHFEKGNPDYKGAYQAINQMFLANAGSDYSRVNREQDLGEAGLRKAKLSYHPVDFLRKKGVAILDGSPGGG